MATTRTKKTAADARASGAASTKKRTINDGPTGRARRGQDDEVEVPKED